MIIKMIERGKRRAGSFQTLVNYMTNPKGTECRVGETLLFNLQSDNPKDAAEEVSIFQGKNQRTEDSDTMHLVVAFAPNEYPSPEILGMIQARILNALGMAEHQCVSVVHKDTDILHIHMAVNKINPKTFNMVTPYQSWAKLGQCCADCERDYGLNPTNHILVHSVAQNDAEFIEKKIRIDENYIRNQAARDMDFRIESESLTRFLKDKMKEPLYGAKTWDEFHKLLADNGLMIRQQANGLVFQSVGSGINVKASSVSRGFSKAALEKKLGPWENSVYMPKGVQKPTQKNPKLFEAYQAYRLSKKKETDKSPKFDQIRESYQEGRDRINAQYQNDRGFAAMLTNAMDRKMYLLNAKRIRDEAMRELQDIAQREREELLKEKRPKPMSWQDWLQSEAAAGNINALLELRTKDAKRIQQDAKKTRSLTGKAPPKLYLQKLKDDIDTVTKHGTVIYKCGDTTVRDTGSLLCVDDGYTPQVLQAVLRAAKDKFQGTGLTVNGTDEFKTKVLIAASLMQEDLQFEDPAIQQKYLTLKEQAYERKRNGRFGIDAYVARQSNRGSSRGGAGRGRALHAGAGRSALHGTSDAGKLDDAHTDADQREARVAADAEHIRDDGESGSQPGSLLPAAIPDSGSPLQRITDARKYIRSPSPNAVINDERCRKGAAKGSVYPKLEDLPRPAFFAIINKRRAEAENRRHDLQKVSGGDVVTRELGERTSRPMQVHSGGIRADGEHRSRNHG